MARRAEPHARLDQADARRAGHRADRHEHVRPLDGAPVGQRHDDPVGRARRRLRPRARHQRHALATEHLFDDVGGVGVLTRQDPVPAGDEHDLGAEREVRPGELRTRDAGPHDDEPLGQARQLVQLRPGQDPLAVGLTAWQDARDGAGRDEHDVGVERMLAPVRLRRHDPPGSLEAARADHHPDALALEPRVHVRRLRGRERLDPDVDLAQVDPMLLRLPDRTGPVDAGVRHGGGVEVDAQVGGAVGDRHPLGGRDERLGGHHVGEDGRPAQPEPLDHGDVRTEPARDERRLVPAGSAPQDDDAARLKVLIGCAHVAILPGAGRPGRPGPSRRVRQVVPGR